MTELADGLANSPNRHLVRVIIQDFEDNVGDVIVPANQDLFARGVALYDQRPDKQWSLTDCISFIIMEDHGITEALTGDHHFEQAGFVALLK